MVLVGQNLGALDELISDKYTQVRKAAGELASGVEVLQMAVVANVNKMKYPDEVLRKLRQLKEAKAKPIEEDPEYKENQIRNYQRYLFVMDKHLP